MNLASLRIITADIQRLVAFYEQITGLPLTWYTDDFAELATASGTIAIGSTRTLQFFPTRALRPADNHTTIIEFRVDDVDHEYEKVRAIGADIVQRPTTMPWGNRSLLFQDPDGNVVNFFTPVSAEAIKKFEA